MGQMSQFRSQPGTVMGPLVAPSTIQDEAHFTSQTGATLCGYVKARMSICGRLAFPTAVCVPCVVRLAYLSFRDFSGTVLP